MTAKRISALFFIICFGLALSSCGRTGKLYLPDEKPMTLNATTTNSHPKQN